MGFSYEDNPGSNSCWINSVKLVIGLMNDVDVAGISENTNYSQTELLMWRGR